MILPDDLALVSHSGDQARPFAGNDHQRIIVIGASAGGVEAVRQLLSYLPANFPAPIFVVLHIPSYSPSYLPEIFSRAGALPAEHAQDGEAIRAGRVYVAPPDHHLLLEAGRMLVKKGPKENRFRPSVDAMFRSAAYTYGPRVVGVVLSGMLDDGTSGLWTVGRLGGTTIVQRPQEAGYEDMPLNAIRQVEVDMVQPLSELAASLIELTAATETGAGGIEVKDVEDELKRINVEIQIAAERNGFDLGVMGLGTPIPLTCPECHGSLLQIHEGNLIRYRCHTGHAYSPAALLDEVTESVEKSFWQTLRILEEKRLLLQRTGESLQISAPAEAQQLLALAAEATKRSKTLHQVMFNPPLPSRGVAEAEPID
ncbi:chemotaxis protein CheB [Deinococcus sp. QL22]|uniref:chemotaxis protein CheB n=1 Tax=Deinococcus sp. QL22 TaxID=2939437 RepID=UPI00201838CA|nr:chemotaxis protein CheB [Deinococcus sp. QL22]UQN10081.1 chemotaxis protein CheB [Deinococcus sp. QL22]